MPSLMGLGFHHPPGRPKTLSFLSVCLFVRHAFESQRLCARFCHEGAVHKRFSCRWIGEGLQLSTRVQLSQTATAANWRHHEMPKSTKRQKLGFSPTEGDRINRSRRNLAGMRILWVCSSTPNLTLIGKRGSVQESP